MDMSSAPKNVILTLERSIGDKIVLNTKQVDYVYLKYAVYNNICVGGGVVDRYV
jgi:hypothetical protein